MWGSVDCFYAFPEDIADYEDLEEGCQGLSFWAKILIFSNDGHFRDCYSFLFALQFSFL